MKDMNQRKFMMKENIRGTKFTLMDKAIMVHRGKLQGLGGEHTMAKVRRTTLRPNCMGLSRHPIEQN